MAEKTVNYTDEMEARLRAVYVPTATQDERIAQVEALSQELNRTTRSIIAKLSRMRNAEGVSLYVPKVYATKKGETPVRKAALVANIAQICGVDEDQVGSLEKATKGALNIVTEALTS